MSVNTVNPRERVLLIDDDELIAGSLCHYLGMQGHEVDVAFDRRSAAALMSVKKYGVIVIDPFLTGGVHGLQGDLLDEIVTLQPSASTIVLTGYLSPALADAAAACRTTALLTKPQSVVYLAELVTGASRAPQRPAHQPETDQGRSA